MSNREEILELFADESFVVIEGTSGSDDLTGGPGSDLIRGLGGDDTLSGLGGNDSLDGGTGSDSLLGGEGNDTLDGGAGNDTMIGGPEDDRYQVNSSNDVITELADEGTDSVFATTSYTLSEYVEKLTLEGRGDLSGTGNDQDNRILGNGGDNLLSGAGGNDILTGSGGDDTLDGGPGSNRLIGGSGDDTYIISTPENIITEQRNESTDTVISTVTFSLESIDNVEKLVLDGNENIDGVGNTLDNTITGNVSDNLLEGREGDDTLRGGIGDDILVGGEGTDLLVGGKGSDTYRLSSPSDTINEVRGNPNDINSVEADFEYVLGNNLQNLTLLGNEDLTGEGNDLDNLLIGNGGSNNLTGLEGNDTLNGGDGDDTLNGGPGADSMIGGLGSDLYIVNNPGDTVLELSTDPEEIDEIRTSVTYTMPENIEILIITNAGNIGATGNAQDNSIEGGDGDNELVGLEGDDTLIGNNGDDTLDGGLGADIMRGGRGSDTYRVDNEEDRIIDGSPNPQDIDTVRSSIDYTLADNLENLVLLGEAVNGTGNDTNNVITGNEQNNNLQGLLGDDELQGEEGNDTLDGGAGVNTLAGGAGNDSYLINNSTDEIIELENEGIDVVTTTVSYELPDNVENMIFAGEGPAPATLIGNDSNNEITGGDGDDSLEGGKGNDSLIGGIGNDTLDGGLGTDTMIAAAGNTTFVVNTRGDVVTKESAAPNEIDTIISSVDYDIVPNVNNITLTSDNNSNSVGNDLNNVMTGNDSDNQLEGGLGNDTLIGSAGDDTLNGGAGTDSMAGGEGDDSYLVNETRDVVTELPDQGTDQVTASVDYIITANFENLTLTDNATRGTGNDEDNEIIGNTNDNNLVGGAGNDTLDGFAGTNRLEGGAGDDNYIIRSTSDTILEILNGGTDTVTSFVDFELSDPNLENLTLSGEEAVNGTGNNLDNVIEGNDQNNLLVGLLGNDTLEGGDGNDTLDGTVLEGETPGIDRLVGGAGNDLYRIDDTEDEVIERENAGIDTIESSVPYDLPRNVENIIFGPVGDLEVTGNGADNMIVTVDGDNLLEGLGGNDTLETGEGNDTLDGGEGADNMSGGAGSDEYIVDNVNDEVRENDKDPDSVDVDLVTSSVTYTLSQNLNNLTLVGSQDINGLGNELENVITGNSGDNRLDGRQGADTMNGGTGNDTYVVDNEGDVVIESGNDSEDIVEASIDYTLGDNIENLTLTGNAVEGTGNRLDNQIVGNQGRNVLTGLDGDDTLDGGTGPDTLIGGLGDDTYRVDNSGDVIREERNEGTDIVLAIASYTLPDNLENLTLEGNGNIEGTGNTLDNNIIGNDNNNNLDGGDGDDTLIGGLGNDSLTGGSANDRLVGGSGQDSLTGGAGEDIFVYESPDQGPDLLVQYIPNDDTIEVSARGFGGGLDAGGAISSDQFTIGSSATTSEQRFIYQQDGGQNILFYDSDGSGPLPQVRLLEMSGRVDLTNNDIVVV
jgi:Ca2+-binding RTX toxin-like protein